VCVFACLLFNAKIPRKVSQPSKRFLFISKPKFHLLSKQHKNLILVVREGISPRRAFLAGRLAIHGSPETTFTVPMIWRESRGHLTDHLRSTDIQGVSFIAEPNAILSRNIGAEEGFVCDQEALLEGDTRFSIDTKLVGERPILCSPSNSAF
jgi:hypothetical protein